MNLRNGKLNVVVANSTIEWKINIDHEITETKHKQTKYRIKSFLVTYPGIFFVVFQFEQ